MFDIVFYQDKKGKEPVKLYLLELSKKKDKDSRIKLNKIRDYIKVLSLHGVTAGEPYIKHLEAEIWEIRPLRDRILFAAYKNQSFVLLYQFMKTTRKTPQQHIERAKKNLKDMIKRGNNNE
ncbi:type II toxin-antitoxin system RelE/ParE family toxin [Testudinibacter sp. TR-2022]|uniref:type II toxin-antitoxin system RelE/ParE family toxin n=1 Tax=Testudinibacter sp. TR-2022 TaxID=2585029 RepID=UPI0011185778|nr:type II toxin-antitoxin system RelE/ParE family toxin [Testudinibacter sp. TR-2022]TNH08436.1 type II toxin-antitoxin system RelE/ParE family toxin [Pasteurellaceae bacterium Phil11]TNH21297.1 type II toxin-antitoxin system RelE/ParE family toxin [Testudinibacter sp. TR-2022]TNH22801.1 type II toxin-antitoxin system RelE/ParE family toxin [Testudinibacter sp. TR-2022]